MVLSKVAYGLSNLKTRPKFLRDNKTYIVPTSFGFVFGFLALVLLLFSIGSGNNLVYLFTFFLISVAHSSMILTNNNVKSLTIEEAQQDFFFANIPSNYRIRFKSTSKRNIYDLSIDLDKNQKKQMNIKVHGHGRLEKLAINSEKEIAVNVTFSKQGAYPDLRWQIASEFPFGLLQAWRLWTAPKIISCYPEPSGHIELSTLAANRHLQLLGDFKSHREFQTGDAIRAIDWKASAKTQKWLIKELQTEDIKKAEFSSDELPLGYSVPQKQSQLVKWALECEASGFSYQYTSGTYRSGYGKGKVHLKEILDQIICL